MCVCMCGHARAASRTRKHARTHTNGSFPPGRPWSRQDHSASELELIGCHRSVYHTAETTQNHKHTHKTHTHNRLLRSGASCFTELLSSGGLWLHVCVCVCLSACTGLYGGSKRPYACMHGCIYVYMYFKS